MRNGISRFKQLRGSAELGLQSETIIYLMMVIIHQIVPGPL